MCNKRLYLVSLLIIGVFWVELELNQSECHFPFPWRARCLCVRGIAKWQIVQVGEAGMLKWPTCSDAGWVIKINIMINSGWVAGGWNRMKHLPVPHTSWLLWHYCAMGAFIQCLLMKVVNRYRKHSYIDATHNHEISWKACAAQHDLKMI